MLPRRSLSTALRWLCRRRAGSQLLRSRGWQGRDDAAADEFLLAAEAALPGLEHVPIVHAGFVEGIRQLREQRAAAFRKRNQFRIQHRNAVGVGPVRTPRRRQARARRARCAKRQADSGGSDGGDGDGPPAEGPPGRLRRNRSRGAVRSSIAVGARGVAGSDSGCEDDAERGTLQRRHRRQRGAELGGTRRRLDTASPCQLRDAHKAYLNDPRPLGVAGAAAPCGVSCAGAERRGAHVRQAVASARGARW
jgi:hypothetical protein